jgi:hypothetical protein
MQQWSAWYYQRARQVAGCLRWRVLAADSTGFFASDAGGFKPTVGQRAAAVVRRSAASQGRTRTRSFPIPVAAMICQANGGPSVRGPADVHCPRGRRTTTAPGCRRRSRIRRRSDSISSPMTPSTRSSLRGPRSAQLSAATIPPRRVGQDRRPRPSVPRRRRPGPGAARLPVGSPGRRHVLAGRGEARGDRVAAPRAARARFGSGNGVIIHALYEGTDDRLGIRVSAERPAGDDAAVRDDGRLRR